LHIFIGDASNRGQGIGTEAMRLALDQAFGALALKEVFLHVLATNQSAIRLYERCGFTLQGKRAAPAEKRCGTVDVLRMSLRKAKREP
jgi:RimJ/RimL family protein N-acetyltransferase